MHPNVYFSPIVASLAIALSQPVEAANVLNLNKHTIAFASSQFKLVSNTSPTLTTTSAALLALSSHTDNNKVSHQRLKQYYFGVEVYGAYAIFHKNEKTNTMIDMNGQLFTDLQAELGAPTQIYFSNQSKALDAFLTTFTKGQQSQKTIQPLVYVNKAGKAIWAYKVSVLIEHDNTIPERPTAILDATTFNPIIQWDTIKTAKKQMVYGRGFGGNEKMGQYEYGVNFPLIEMTRDTKSEKCSLETKSVKVVDMNHKTRSKGNKAMTFECESPIDDSDDDIYMTGYESDGYDEINGAYSPTNDAMYAGYVIKHMYFDWYGLQALVTRDKKPMKLVMRVHYGYEYENAFWDGEQMTFGDGESFFHPLVSLGVGSHEISHGFTEQHSGLEYYGQSGGMNESFSDMAAQAAEYYSTGTSSWMIGAEIVKADQSLEALRFMDKPSRDGESIDTADQYNDNLDVHYSSGVYNHLFYIMANQPGFDTRKAFDIMVKANTDYWTPYVDFQSGACGVIKATHDLGYPIEPVMSSLEEVKIDTSSCE
jgi:pseudolysin